jgi:hypothetical protein
MNEQEQTHNSNEQTEAKAEPVVEAEKPRKDLKGPTMHSSLYSLRGEDLEKYLKELDGRE